ncbi:MAG TPA: hypothetical protein DDX92_05425 [Flavobacteriales bacterium]|jgi:HPt (histidine-containing phosphotransfer) domain-containing protein|nr:hypothetical protein [Flavobacteriales bacterium]
MDDNLYDLNILSELVMGDEGFMKELINTFIDTAPQDVASIEKAVHDESFEDVRKITHKLKSSVRTLGMHALEPVVLSLEKMGKEQEDFNAIREKFREFQILLERTIEQLKQEDILR